MPLWGQQSIRNYDAEWKKVEDFVSKGLPQSALTEVDNIYALAKKEKQDAQIIKALVKKLDLQKELRENDQQLAIKSLQEEINGATEPVRSILYAILGDAYRNQYQSLRWQIMNRTRIPGERPKDTETWTTADFMEVTGDCYLKSIANRTLLQSIKLEPLDAIITKGNTRKLRPTLFDLLAHKALEFFENDERNITRPAYAFELSQPEVFADAATFSKFQFKTQDTLSLDFRALQIYQELLQFHLQDTDADALIDADINRLQYVYSKSVNPARDTLFVGALEKLTRKYATNQASAQASYHLAQWYMDKANQYQPFGDTTQRFAAVKAYRIAEEVSNKFPKSEGGVNLYNLKQGILAPQLSLNFEKVSVPNKPILMLLSFKNAPKASFRLIKVTENLRGIEEKDWQSKLWQALKNAPAVKTWEQVLPKTNDYQNHRVELKIDPVPIGSYYLTAAGGGTWGQAQAIARFSASNLSFINRGPEYFVLDRDSGEPLENIEVQVWNQRYDNASRTYKREKTGKYRTDKSGHFNMSKDNRDGGLFLELTGNGDHLFLDDQQRFYTNSEPASESDVRTMFFFTDRSIYRPGQQLFFKGILLKKKGGEKQSEIVASTKVTVQLFDVNGQVVDSLKASTNEFGTVSGKFTLPVSGLTGNFRIEARQINGAAYFNVEEYKRPSFKVEIDKPVAAVKLSENISIAGLAKAFAGNPIDGAIVKYRVERVARFPYPWRFAKGFWPVSPPMQIASGETVTDAEGRFTVTFSAIPDASISRDKDPVFDYMVYADVTDGSGESRSGNQVVSAGYKPLILKVNIAESIERDSLKVLAVRTENTNGGFLPAKVTLTVRKLVPETRLIRDRQWERPDQFLMSKAEFVKLFPLDEYNDEKNPASWKKGEEVARFTKETNENGTFSWSDAAKIAPGFYEFEFVTKATDGQEVKDIRGIEVVDPRQEILSRPAFLWVRNSKPVKPGEEAVIQIGTSAAPVYLIRVVEKIVGNGRKTELEYSKKENGVDAYRIPVTDADRGGFGVDFVFVKNNRVFRHQETINVSNTDKELKITYGTFRDKTLPGSEEKWTLTIAGSNGEKVAAELLASMYDASLDEFQTHKWEKPSIWPGYFPLSYWGVNGSFGTKFSQQIYDRRNQTYRRFEKQYDALNSLLYYSGFYMSQTLRVGSSARGGVREETLAKTSAPSPAVLEENVAADAVQFELGSKKDTGNGVGAPQNPGGDQPVRKDFRETVFFYPELKLSEDGSVTFSFKMPEALTRWKFQALAHTKDLSFGLSTQEIITQKELMVQPNMPRFLRIGDKLAIAARVVNLSDKALSGKATISISDAATGASLNEKFAIAKKEVDFNVPAGQSGAVSFPLSVPEGSTMPVLIRIVANAGAFQDGEEHTIAVLTNQMLVTETMPLWMKGTGTKSFTFEKLVNSKPGGTLQNHALTVEYTGNPVWYAVQALPYLMEYPHDCAEQTWNRYYANALSKHLVNSSPRLDQIFKTWRDLDTSALLSNLQKNQELKALLLEETPWVLAAESESEQKRNLAVLFDLVRMKSEAGSALSKLQKMQRSEGSFPWFSQGPDDRYVTQYIISGIGHLNKLAKPSPEEEQVLNQIVVRGLEYLDSRMTRDYLEMVERKVDMKKYTPSPLIVQYLYMRSFFPNIDVAAANKKSYAYFLDRLAENWVAQGKNLQAMTALTLSRSGNKSVASAIMKSLKETSIRSEELGTYWKSASRSWWWQDAPIEQHALLTEAFQEVAQDKDMADGIRTWLLANKRTNSWESTKATAEACYALLLNGNDWVNDNPEVTVTFGKQSLSSADGKEAGTGYIKASIPGSEVTPQQGNIKLKVAGSGAVKGRPSWGGIYWQYFENLDKITFSETPLKIRKKLYIRETGDRGAVLKELAPGNRVKIGDKLTVRIELTVDRDMEYVHMKDMRGAGLEPVNVLSSNKFQDGLAYYESTRDAATNFFFGYLPKGTYVFEYPLNVSHQGDFSNGVTTIQCMYAPEFTAHSEGIRLKVD